MDMLRLLAQLIDPGEVDNLPNSAPGTDGTDIFLGGLNLVYYVSGVVAVIVIIIGGLLYISSYGDQNKITRAKQLVMYSVIGLIIVALAFTITQFVIGRFA